MLDAQDEAHEHDNEIGDNTSQEDDRVSKSKDSDQKDLSAKKNEEPSPLEHLVELIVGDRFPTEFEYLRWLESEDQRNNHELYMEYNSKQ